MPASARTASNDAAKLAGSISDEELELGGAATEIHYPVADLLSGPSAIGVGARAQHVHASVCDWRMNNT
jgi:hypothetical protein